MFLSLADRLTKENGYRVGTPGEVLYVVNGEINDWLYGDNNSRPGCYGFTAEVGSESDGFWPPMERIVPLCLDALNQNLMLASLAGNYSETTDISPLNICGHEGYIMYKTKRLGLTPGTFSVRIEGLGDYFETTGNTTTHPNMDLLEVAYNAVPFSLRSGIRRNEKIRYEIITTCGNRIFRDTVTRIFGKATTAFHDPIAGFENWSSDNWDITDESNTSPEWCITDSPYENYMNNQNEWLYIDTLIDLTDAKSAWMTFYTKWHLDGGNDFVKILASADDGQSWETLSGTFSNSITTGNLTEPVYTGTMESWDMETIDLSDYTGSEIKVAFQLITDHYYTDDGFYLDEFKVHNINPAPHLVQEVTLLKGWNSLSSYLIPNQMDIDSVLYPITDYAEILVSNVGFYQPGSTNSTIQKWNSSDGFMIKLSEAATLTISGEMESIHTLQFTPGWHLIPCLSDHVVSINQLNLQPESVIEIIQEPATRNIYWPAKNLFTLDSLVPGRSYQVKINEHGIVGFQD